MLPRAVINRKNRDYTALVFLRFSHHALNVGLHSQQTSVQDNNIVSSVRAA